MALSRGESKKLLKNKLNSMEDAINAMEKELNKDEDSFKMHILSFHFGRLQQLYLEVYSVAEDAEWI